MTTKRIDFVNLTEFLRTHPWLTEEERAAVLDLDTHNKDFKDRSMKVNTSEYTARGFKVLDLVEIKNFFAANPDNVRTKLGIKKSDSSTSAKYYDETSWQAYLTNFIFENYATDYLQRTLANDFLPAPPGKKFTSDPYTNLDLYAERVKLEADTLIRAKGGAANMTDGDIAKLLDTLFIQHDRLQIEIIVTDEFWLLIDPENRAPELRLRFLHALTESAAILSYSTDPLSWANEFTTTLKMSVSKPLPEGPIPAPDDWNTRSYTEAFIIQEDRRGEFEELISDRGFIEALNGHKALPKSIMERLERCLSPNYIYYDMGYDMLVADIMIDCYEGQGHPGSKVLSISLVDIISRNGYSDVITSTNHIDGFVQTVNSKTIVWEFAPKISQISDVQLMDISDDTWFKDVWSQDFTVGTGPSFAKITVDMDSLLLSRLAFVPSLCRNGFISELGTKNPWLAPLTQKLGVDANAQTTLFAQNLSESFIRYALIATKFREHETPFTEGLALETTEMGRYNLEDVLLMACLDSFKKCADPRAGLCLLLYFASLDNQLGNYLRGKLPYLFHEIHYEITDSKIIPDGMEISSGKYTLGNAWHTWNKQALADIAAQLATADLASLKGHINDFVPEIYERKFAVYDDYFSVTEKAGLPPRTKQKLPAPQYEKNIPAAPLIKKLRLQATRDKIAALDPLQIGHIELQEILKLELTGPEREDLKRAFAVAYVFNYKKIFAKVGLKLAINKEQLELLPAPIIAQLIVNGASDRREALWIALFRASEVSGLDIFEKTITACHEKEKDTKKSHELWPPYPAPNDLQTALPYVIASRSKHATQLLSENRELLDGLTHQDQITDLRLGKTGIIANSLAWIDLTFNEQKDSSPAASLIALFKSVSLIKTARSLYADLDLAAVADAGFFYESPPNYREFVTNYYHLTPDTNNDLTRDSVLAIIADLDTTIGLIKNEQTKFKLIEGPAGDEKKAFRAANMIANLGYLIAANDSLNHDAQVKTALIHLCKTYLQNRPDKSSPLTHCPVMTVLANSMKAGEKLAAELEFLVAIYYPDIELNTVTQERFFKDNNGKRVFMLTQLWTWPIIYHDVGIELKKMRFGTKGWSELQTNSPFSPMGGLIIRMAELQESFGEFSVEHFATLKDTYELAKAYRGVAAELPQLKSPGSLQCFANGDPVLIKIIENLKKLPLAGDMSITDTTATWSKYLSAQTSMTLQFGNLARLDKMVYPKNVTDSDETEFTANEVKAFNWHVTWVLKDFTEDLLFWIKMALQGMPLDLDPAQIAAMTVVTDNEIPISPWHTYCLTLVRSFAGDKSALEELTAYNSGDKSMTTGIAIFDNAIDDFLKIGRFILMYWDTDRYLTGSTSVNLGDELMALVEFGKPDENIPQLREHWKNSDADVNRDQPVDEHAGMTAQTLLGNPTYTRKASGKVWNYVFDNHAQNLWQEFDDTLNKLIIDIESGVDISVCNFSFGLSGLPALGPEFETLTDSKIVANIKKKIKKLTQLRVPLVISAGNAGEVPGDDHARAANLEFFNWLGLLDPAIIMVGSAKINDSRGRSGDFAASQFSSPGNQTVRPDITGIGEGYMFMATQGGKEDIAGTSFSAPSVARLIAKMKALNPRLTVEMIQAILKATAFDITSAVPEKEGAGQVNPTACLYLAGSINMLKSRKTKDALAQELGLSTQAQKGLDWLAGRLRLKVLVIDTFRQKAFE